MPKKCAFEYFFYILMVYTNVHVNSLSIEIEKERMASPNLTREIVYKKVAKYKGMSWFAHKLRQLYKLYFIAAFLS